MASLLTQEKLASLLHGICEGERKVNFNEINLLQGRSMQTTALSAIGFWGAKPFADSTGFQWAISRITTFPTSLFQTAIPSWTVTLPFFSAILTNTAIRETYEEFIELSFRSKIPASKRHRAPNTSVHGQANSFYELEMALDETPFSSKSSQMPSNTISVREERLT